jgi:hypothetical protein
MLKNDKSYIVTPAGIEPAIFGMKARRPRPLDDGAVYVCVIIQKYAWKNKYSKPFYLSIAGEVGIMSRSIWMTNMGR